MNERLLHPPPSQLVVDVLHRKAGDDKKGLILFWVQTESMGEVAAVVIARIEREPEGLGSGQESWWLAMWPNKVSDLTGISRNSEPNWKPTRHGVRSTLAILVRCL